MDEKDVFIPIARFGKTYGVHGALRLYIFSDCYQRFCTYNFYICKSNSYLPINSKDYTIVCRGPEKIYWSFREISTPEDATVYVNILLYTSRSCLPDLDSDDVYHIDLLGSQVHNSYDHKELGTITDILPTGLYDVLVIKDNDTEILIPYHKVYIQKFYIDKKKLIVFWEY